MKQYRGNTLVIGALSFTSDHEAMIQSLFGSGGTAHGTYSVRPDGVMLHDMTGKARVFLCTLDPDGPFFVSTDGVVFMHSLTDADLRWMGVHESSYSERCQLAQYVASAAN